MQVSSKKYRLGDILLKQGVITEEQLNQVLTEQGKNHRHIGDLLVEHGYVTDEMIAKALHAILCL